MASEKRLIYADDLRQHWLENGENEHIYDTNAFLESIDEQTTVKAVPVDEILRVIAGHSNYHGDNILSALICIAEGKKVDPVRPLEKVDAVEVVRCKDCKSCYTESPEGFYDCCLHGMYVRPDDFCSYGERKDK